MQNSDKKYLYNPDSKFIHIRGMCPSANKNSNNFKIYSTIEEIKEENGNNVKMCKVCEGLFHGEIQIPEDKTNEQMNDKVQLNGTNNKIRTFLIIGILLVISIIICVLAYKSYNKKKLVDMATQAITDKCDEFIESYDYDEMLPYYQVNSISYTLKSVEYEGNTLWPTFKVAIDWYVDETFFKYASELSDITTTSWYNKCHYALSERLEVDDGYILLNFYSSNSDVDNLFSVNVNGETFTGSDYYRQENEKKREEYSKNWSWAF